MEPKALLDTCFDEAYRESIGKAKPGNAGKRLREIIQDQPEIRALAEERLAHFQALRFEQRTCHISNIHRDFLEKELNNA